LRDIDSKLQYDKREEGAVGVLRKGRMEYRGWDGEEYRGTRKAITNSTFKTIGIASYSYLASHTRVPHRPA
jgi:hypothetical protein